MQRERPKRLVGRKGLSTEAGHGAGDARSREEGSVMSYAETG